jgi:predicted DNA-binding protein
MSAVKRGKSRLHTSSTPRASVSFPPELYRNLELVAKKKKVSIAWVVREAAEKYIADQLSQNSGGIP